MDLKDLNATRTLSPLSDSKSKTWEEGTFGGCKHIPEKLFRLSDSVTPTSSKTDTLYSHFNSAMPRLTHPCHPTNHSSHEISHGTSIHCQW
ncbi:unnamed protein product [Sphenostylis stenocarpa]|uniref:Uncharacterized protein n=1 Tax=Sphenostylis stenocarpa TaxID=92480 RepID=A0AA86W596_9FABA|nr:unnamed protein product [Sphenostylis stenocarpa]